MLDTSNVALDKVTAFLDGLEEADRIRQVRELGKKELVLHLSDRLDGIPGTSVRPGEWQFLFNIGAPF